jgi:metal-responsive CopG/Arc/MetJ family transcriptional regulator
MSKKVFLGATIDADVLKSIDQVRGMVKRSTFVNDILRKSVGHVNA